MATASLSSTALFFVATNEATFAAAREGSGVSKYISQYGWVGQYYGGNYEVNQVFAGFDLSSLPANAQITAAKLTLTIAESFGTTVVEVRQHDFANNSINAFVAGSQLASKPMLGGTVVNNGFIGTVAIDLTGLTRDGLAKFVLASTSQRTGTAPTGDTTTRVTAAKLDITYAASPEIITTTGSGSWVVPAGVTAITVECWGGGGGGVAGNAGGGGAYARKDTITVTPGASLPYSVGVGAPGTGGAAGVTGGDTWFGNTVSTSSPVLAKGGSMWFVTQPNPTYGRADQSIGDVRFNGGGGATSGFNGGGSSATKSGAGRAGGSGFSDYTGGSANGGGAGGGNVSPGASNVEGGGGGGGNPSTGPGGAGGAPSGGGGAPGNNVGTLGGRGQIRISWASSTTPAPDRRAPRSFFWF
ncbi:hypothetical protein [Brevundimonas sp.]|uniref:glycine-rich domain-containing protein n=1 Tax=Brevundimonas sp. TaxID=1871086 RepID=UPI0028974EA0|nr:hypothetical protein [Brevundimonas sp.]